MPRNMARNMATDTTRLGRIFTCIRNGGWVTWLVSTLVLVLSLPFTGRYIHGQIPESIRSHIPVQQVQDALNFVNPAILAWMLPEEQTEEKTYAIEMEMQVPTSPNPKENEVVEKFEQDKELTNVKHLSRCQRWTNVNATQYDQKVQTLGKVINLPEDMIEELKSAKYSDEEVNALEKFDLGHDGAFYFGKFTSKRRYDGNMDLALVLYGFKWNQVNKNWISGEVTKSLQSMTSKQKDLCLKSWRSRVVKWFSEICQPDLLKLVEQTRPVSSVNIDEEDKITLKQFERLVKALEEKGIPVPVEL